MHSQWISVGVNGFSDIAMTTSFLGVTLGLFDFLADGLKRQNTRAGRLQTALITFIPPLFFALYYPKGFITALGYAGLCVTVLEVILPALMVYRLRKSSTLNSPYRMKGGLSVLGIVLLAGVLLIIMQLWQPL
jgi:tyrosine-specific transport protein